MNKRHLIIKNLGPIKDIDINLNRFNFFIGPQSIGKSTIAKVISTCEWIEKEVATTLDPKCIGNGEDFRSLIEKFHKINGYFDKSVNTSIIYETEIVRIVYQNKEFRVDLLNVDLYRRQKISYIPSERNMVSLPELDGFEFKNTNLKSFLFDWWTARDSFTSDNKVEILDMGYRYYFDKERKENKDRIQHSNGVTYDISFADSSSGLQSITPLFIMLKYYSSKYFSEYDAKTSYKDESKLHQTRIRLMGHYIFSKLYPDYKNEKLVTMLQQVNDRLERMDKEMLKLYADYENAIKRLQIPVRASFIIEEPEQNLFPSTQVKLLQTIFSLCLADKQHKCTVTTHSPYMLYALNNCMLAYIVRENLDDETYTESESAKCLINPEEVSVWSIKDGYICNDKEERNVTIQDARGLIRKNYFNDIMRSVMNEFNELLSYDY